MTEQVRRMLQQEDERVGGDAERPAPAAPEQGEVSEEAVREGLERLDRNGP